MTASPTALVGSLGSLHLPAIVRFLSELEKSGQVTVAAGQWRGEVTLAGGAVVGATLGTESGRAAFESIALGVPDGRFLFREELTSASAGDGWRVERNELPAYLDALTAERGRLLGAVSSLSLVPRLAAAGIVPTREATVTIDADALMLLAELPGGRTVEQIALERGLARTVRHIASLVELGVISLDNQPAERPNLAVSSPQPRLQTLVRPLLGFFLAEPAAR
jgi:hypothetical protein